MGSKKKYCTITVHETGEPSYSGEMFVVEVFSSYCDLFVAELKRTIWGADRRWDEQAKRWWIVRIHLEHVKRLALEHYDNVYLVEGDAKTNLRDGTRTEAMRLF